MSIREFWRVVAGAALVALTASLVRPALAQDPAADYPNRVVRVVVGFAAGGGNDVFARVVAQKLQEVLGQSVVIENKPGAGGRIAADYVLSQPADGYTLMVAPTGTMSVAAAVYAKMSFHPTRNFAPISMIARYPLILVIPADHPAKNVKELVAWAKANPDKSNYGTTSPSFTLAAELFKLKTGMPAVGVPYKSSNEVLLAVVNGGSLFAVADGPPTVPLVQGGKVRALAVTGNVRSPQFPDVPSMAEAGFPAVDTHLWSGFFAHAATPPGILKKLEAAIRRSIQSPETADKLKALAVAPSGSSSEEFRRMIEDEIKSYADIAKAANLTFAQ